MKSWNKVVSCLFEQKHLASLLTHIDREKKWCIAVSGGPDSMLLTHLCLGYFQDAGKIENISLLHFNHKQRPTADQELQLLQNYFSEIKFINDEYKGESKKEHDLRTARWSFFEEQITSHQAAGVITGHNLTDRLETTIMNCERGCGLLGFLNMTKVDTTYHYPADGGVYQYNIVRPLLSLPKQKILEICQDCGVLFMTDPSNKLNTVSYRNKVRKRTTNSLPSLSKNQQNSFFEQIDNLYKKLENNSSTCKETVLQSSMFWGDELPYFTTPIPRSRHELTSLLSRLKIYKGPTKGTIDELYGYLTTKGGGRKQYAGWYLFRGYDNCYFVKAEQKFWKEYVKTTKEIDHPGVYRFGDFTWDVDDKYTGGILRFPQTGDKYHGKSLFTWMNNQQIPIFWRKYIPLIEQKGTIVCVFPEENPHTNYW